MRFCTIAALILSASYCFAQEPAINNEPPPSIEEILSKRESNLKQADQDAVVALEKYATNIVVANPQKGIGLATRAWESVAAIDPANKRAKAFFKMIGRDIKPNKTGPLQRTRWQGGRNDHVTYTRLPSGKWTEEFDGKRYVFDETKNTPTVIEISNGKWTTRLYAGARYYSNDQENWKFMTGEWKE